MMRHDETSPPATTSKRVAVYILRPHDAALANALAANVDAFAQTHGHIVGRFHEPSDGSTRRTKLTRLLARATAGGFDILCVGAIGMLGRSQLRALRLARELDALGVEIVSYSEQWFDVHAAVIDLLVADESQRLDRSARAIDEKRSRGERVGELLYGYHCADGLNVEPSPKEQAVIAMVLRLADDGWPHRRIARHLNDQGYRSRRGTAITHGLVGRIILRRLTNLEEPAR
jgi:DNA invertase Pin-like site-specific DNA recombinase